jgi:hypothetical protein
VTGIAHTEGGEMLDGEEEGGQEKEEVGIPA